METILEFLKLLKANNNKEWFQENKSLYEATSQRFKERIEAILAKLLQMDPSIGDLKVSQCLFRIYRDTRFSKNPEPYKTNFGAFMAMGGRNSGKAGYYLHLEPGGSFVGGGVYMPEPPALKAIRDEIYFHADEFKAIISESAFLARFGGLGEEGRLKRPPKGYDPGFPEIELLKHKHYVVGQYFQDEAVGQTGFEQEVLHAFKTMQPLNLFLNRAISYMQ